MKAGLNHREIAEVYYLVDTLEDLLSWSNKEQRVHLMKYLIHKMKPLAKEAAQ